MLSMARFAGLRCCEIATSHSSWLVSGSLLVPGKGGSVDPIPAHPRIVELFTEHGGYLMPSHSSRGGQHLLANAVSAIGNKHLAAYAPGWTMHKLRHAFVSDVYERCGDLGVAQSAARHRSPETTRGYARLSNKRLASVVCSIDVA